jgi:transcriptional regulator with XRE-family HTH domain
MKAATVDLRRRRQAAGLSQEDLAAVVGVTPQAISLWERGRRRPRPATVARILEALRMLEGSGER